MSDNEQEDYESNVGSVSDDESVVSDNVSVVSETVEVEPGVGEEVDLSEAEDDETEADGTEVDETEVDENYDSDDEPKEDNPDTLVDVVGKKKSSQNFTVEQVGIYDDNGEGDEDDDEDDAYLQKFNEQINRNYIVDNHPECVNVNFDEVLAMVNVVRDEKNNIVDDLHKTLPYLTKYEKARILGQRARQINSGMTAFIKVPENVIDGYLIAEMELAQKRIPFIIKRPIPGGGCEYWRVSDLELVCF